jgi:hypothetical protein
MLNKTGTQEKIIAPRRQEKYILILPNLARFASLREPLVLDWNFTELLTC